MEANQKILYNHFIKQSKEHENDIIRERCKRNAEEILKSFPQFEVKEVKKTNSKEVKEKK